MSDYRKPGILLNFNMKIKLTQLGATRILLSLSLFIIVIASGWAKGGRWDLNEQILTGYRLVRDYPSAYLTGNDGGFAPTTVYSYLQPLLLGLLTLTIKPKSVELVSVFLIAPSIGIVFYNLLLSLSLRLLPERYPRQLLSLYALALFGVLALSTDYLFYLSELKPDTLALVFLGLALYSTVRFRSQKVRQKLSSPFRFDSALPVAVMIFLAVSTKQQIMLPVLVSALFLVFKAHSLYYGLLYVSSSLAGIILPSLAMPGYSVMTIYSHAGRGYENIPLSILRSAQSTFLVVATLCTVFVLAGSIIDISKSTRVSLFGRRMLLPLMSVQPSGLSVAIPEDNGTKQGSVINHGAKDLKNSYGLFLVASLSWFFAQLASTLNYGGNQGNLQVGILPLVAIAAPLAFRVNIFSSSVVTSKYLSFAFIAAVFILPATILVCGHSIRKYPSYVTRDSSFRQSIKSSSSSHHQSVLVDGDSSLIAFESGFTRQISLYHAGHLSAGKKENLSGQAFVQHLRNSSTEGKLFYFLTYPLEQYKDNYKLRYLRKLKTASQTCLKGKEFCYGYLDFKT